MNEVIEKSVVSQPLTATRAAAKGRCVGVEAAPLAHASKKGQKIVAEGVDDHAVRLEFAAVRR